MIFKNKYKKKINKSFNCNIKYKLSNNKLKQNTIINQNNIIKKNWFLKKK